jgi:hypothetical protein
MTRLELATSTFGAVSPPARVRRSVALRARGDQVERMTRLELATSTLGRSRSTN